MKTAIVFVVCLVLTGYSYAQFPSTDSLRGYNNKNIDNNAQKAFTNLRLHNLLAGIIDFIDTARSGGGSVALGLDTLWSSNDTTIIYRKNGTFRSFTIRGAYDYRRKVDTLYKQNDSTIAFTVNGLVRTIIFPGGLKSLQDVTQIGDKTTDTISAAGLRTPLLLPDTTQTEDDWELTIFGDIHAPYTYVPNAYYAQTRFVRDSAVSANIKAVLQLGDLTTYWSQPEFDTVNKGWAHIDTSGVPYLAIPGNHDYYNENICARNASLTTYDANFGPSRYIGKSWYGGYYGYQKGNAYIKFKGGVDSFLVIGLEMLPSDSAIVWAQRVLDSFPTYKAIITTHAYITYYGEKSVDSTKWSTDTGNSGYGNCGATGQRLWDKLIKNNKQIVFVFNGHFIPNDFSTTKLPTFQRIIQTGTYGNTVNQFAYNDQMDTTDGRISYLLRLKFLPAQGKIRVSMYSPYMDKYNSLYPTYYIDYPSLSVENTISVGGRLNASGETRLDSTIFLAAYNKNSILVVGTGNQIDTADANNGLQYSSTTKSIMLGQDSGLIDVAKLVNNREIPLNGHNIIYTGTGKIGIGKPNPGTTLDVNGTVSVGDRGYPSSGLYNNAPATLYVNHGTNNYGLTITRATNDGSSPHLAFLKTRGTTADQRVTVQPGDLLGTISWHGIANSGIVDISAQYNVNVQGTTTSTVSSYMTWGTTDINGNFGRRMRLQHNGYLHLANSVTADGMDRLWVEGTAKITDTFKLPNVAFKDDTTNYKPAVFDTNGNMFKLSYWPNHNVIKKYVAYINQSGTSNPVATELENTLGVTLTWTRNSAGDYTVTASGSIFTSGKTWLLVGANSPDVEGGITQVALDRTGDTTLSFQFGTGGNKVDDVVMVPIEIRIYP